MISNNRQPKFDLGQVLATPGALSLLEESDESAATFLRRHAEGDWGEGLCDEDRQLNDDAIKDGSRILSSYRVGNDNSNLWIITEAEDDEGHRAASTILLSSEY